MNRIQRLVLMIGSIAILAITLFPPWVYEMSNEGKHVGKHYFLFAPPNQEDIANSYQAQGGMSVWMDTPRFAGELAGIVLATIGLVLAFWRRTG